MIVVTGSITARPDAVDEVVRLGLEHVQRSRLEPGCLMHSVHRDAEDPNRVVFIEHWADAEALRTHFRVAESRAFAEAASALSDHPPVIEIFQATRTSIH